MTAIRPSAPAMRVAPRAAVRPAALADTAAARPAQRPVARPVPAAKPAAMPAVSARAIGTVGGLAAGGGVGWLFGAILASGGMSGVLPIALGVGAAALFARGGAVIADAIAGKAKKPTWGQGLAGGAAGLTMGAVVWGLTAFAGGMGMVPWIAAASIPMGLATLVLGGAAVGSFLPGRK